MYKNSFLDSFFRTKRIFKIISMILVESLLFSSIVWADQGVVLNSDNLKIPKSFGSIKERFEAEGENTLIIHIQDTHTSYSAQKHLSKILKYLSDNYGIDVVGIEGAIDTINTSEFSKFPDRSVKDKVAEYFLKEGKIDGAEYLCIVENTGDGQELIKLQGIEAEGLYKNNLDAFLRSLPYQSELVFFCDVTNDNIEKIKKHVYSESLLAYDGAVKAFKDNKVNFVSYCQQLIKFSEENLVEFDNMPNLDKLFSLIELEAKINFPRVDVERYVAVRRISDKLPEDESTELLGNEFSFRSKKMSSEEYHFYLNDLFARHEFKLDEFTHLKNYMEYLSAFAVMEHNSALAESVVLEEKIYEVLLQNENQRELYEVSRYIHLMSKFSRLQMTRKYIHKYHDYRSRYKLEKVISYLQREAKEYDEKLAIAFDLSVVNTNLENFEEFYKLAGLREQKMVENAISLMKKENKKAIVLIAGGFHTRGITEMLQKEKVSYVVVTPNMENEKNPIPYISLLKNLRTPLEQMIATHTSTLKVASWLTDGEPLAYKANKAIMTNKMKMLLSTTKLYDLYMGMLVQYSPEERVLIQQKLQNHLRDTINKVISSVGYDDVLVVDSVDLNFKHDISTKQDLIAKIRFKDASTVYVKYSDNVNVTKEAEEGFLELVRLQDGIATEFMGSLGYVKVTSDYKLLVSQIISSIFDQPKTIKVITDELNKDKTEDLLEEDDLALYMDSLVNLGLIGTKNKQFYVVGEELGEGKIVKITPYLIKTLMGKMSVSENKGLGLASLNIEEMPENYRNVFNRLNVDRLLVDPTISITDIKDFVHKLIELNKTIPLDSESLISLPLKIDISEKVQINISYTISESGVFKYSFHLMLKPSVTGKVDFDQAIKDETSFDSVYINETSKNPLEQRYINELKEIKNRFGGEISTNLLSDGEKEALIDYICNKLGKKPIEGSQLYVALHHYMGLDKAVTPMYSKRVGAVLLGDRFDSEFKNTFLLLTRLSPNIELTLDIENRIVSTLVGIQLNKDKGIRTEIGWFNLLLYVFKSAPDAISNNRLNATVMKALKLIKKRSDELGGLIDLNEITRIVNSQILLSEIGETTIVPVPVLSKLEKRAEILDNLMASGKSTMFEAVNKKYSVGVTIVQKNADGTYLALDKNAGIGYKVYPLSYDTGINEFKFHNLQNDTPNGFNDLAGFYIQKMPVDKIFPDAGESRVRYLSALLKKRQGFVDSRSSDNIEARLDGIMKMPTRADKSVQDSINAFSQETAELKRVASENLSTDKWKIREIETQDDILAFLKIELKKLQKNKDAGNLQIQRYNHDLVKLKDARRNADFFSKNSLETVISYVVARKMILILREHLKIERTKLPINSALKSWFGTQFVTGNKSALLHGLNLKNLLSHKDSKGVSLVKYLFDELVPLVGEAEAKLAIKNMLDASSNHKIKTDIVANFENTYQIFNNLSGLILNTPNDLVNDEIRNRVKNMDSLMSEAVKTTIYKEAFRKNTQKLRDLNKEISEKNRLVRNITLKRSHYPQEENRLIEDILNTQKNIKDAKENKARLSGQVIDLALDVSYTGFLARAVDELQKRIANGETSVKIDGKDVQIIADNIPLIVSSIAHKFVGIECIATEKRAKTYKERELAEKLFSLSFSRYYEKTKSVADRNVPFKELMEQFQGKLLLYGENTNNTFNLFQNKTDNYELAALIDRSLVLIQKVDPAVYNYIKNEGRIVVAGQPFLPAGGAGLSKVHDISAKDKTVYIEKAVFGNIVELLKTNPREAVKLMAAAIEVSAQGILQQHDSIINLNSANADEIVDFMINRFKQEKPETEPISPKLQALFERTAQTIVKTRSEYGGFKKRQDIISLENALNAINKSLWPFIGQYVKFSDYNSQNAHDFGLRGASRIFGADYEAYRNALKEEQLIYRDGIVKTQDTKAHMFTSQTDYQTSVFSNKTLSSQDKYKVFFSRLFGFDYIFDSILVKILDFNTQSPILDYLNLVGDLNSSIDALLNVENYKFETKFKDRKRKVLITAPDGVRALVSPEAKDKFIQSLNDYRKNLQFYYRHGEGVGLSFTDEAQKIRELPILFGSLDTAKINNSILAQARLRGEVDMKIQTPFANNVSTLMSVDRALAGDDIDAIDGKFSDRDLAEKLKTQFDLFIRTLSHDLSDSERKGLSALFLANNNDLSNIDIELVSYVSGIYDENVPIVINNNITDLSLGLTDLQPTEQFGYAKAQLVDLTLHSDWKQFDPSVRKAIFETLIDRYSISITEKRTLDKLFAQVDREAFVAELSELSSSAISFMWETEKQVLTVSDDLAFIKETFEFYSYLTNISKEAFLKKQQVSGEEWGDAEALDMKEFLFLEKRLSDGLLAVTMQFLNDFNEKHKGVVRINTDSIFVSGNTGKVYDLLLELTKGFNADQSVAEGSVKSKQALDKYFQARKLWFNGMRAEAKDLLTDVVIDVGLLEKAGVISYGGLSDEIKSDVDFLGQIMDGKEDDYSSEDLFVSLSKLFTVTLNPVPAESYISARLNLDNYIGHDITLESGVTDVVIHLKDHTDSEKFSNETQTAYYSDHGVGYEESNIFIDIDNFDLRNEASRSVLGEVFKDSDRAKIVEIEQALKRLEELGYPKNTKLLKIGRAHV